MKVMTKLGLLERRSLEVRDTVVNEENSRTTATEWYLGAELVRRDVWVNILRGEAMGAEANL